MRSLIITVGFVLIVTAVVTVSEIGMASDSQKFCPVMGGAINRELFVDYKGKRIYFCCSVCLPQFKESPDEYIQQLEDDGVKLKVIAN